MTRRTYENPHLVADEVRRENNRQLLGFIGWLAGRPSLNVVILIVGLGLMSKAMHMAAMYGTDEGDFIYGGLAITVYALYRICRYIFPQPVARRHEIGMPSGLNGE